MVEERYIVVWEYFMLGFSAGVCWVGVEKSFLIIYEFAKGEIVILVRGKIVIKIYFKMMCYNFLFTIFSFQVRSAILIFDYFALSKNSYKFLIPHPLSNNGSNGKIFQQ